MRSTSKLVLSATVATTVASLFPASARAVDYVWGVTGGGAQSWQVPGNWSPAGFPNANIDTANLSVGLTNNLTLDVGATDVTTGILTLGGTAGPVTTNIVSTGGALVIDNGAVGPVINSVGVAGSVNTISAPVRMAGPGELTHNLDVNGTNSLVINSLSQVGPPTDISGSEGNGQRHVHNNLPTGATLTINNLTITDPTDTVARRIILRGTGTTIVGTIQNGISPTVGVNGGYGTLTLGLNTGATTLPIALPRYVLNGNSTGYSGTTIFDRGTLVFGHDSALGTGELRAGNPANHYGFNIESTDDARSIANDFRTVQNITYRGQNSITWTGWQMLTANRDATWMNLLPAGKSLNLNGSIASSLGGDTGRRMSFDGPGLTVVNGNMYNHRAPYHPGSAGDTQTDLTSTGIVIKNGTGNVLFNGTGSTYDGQTILGGGYLQFASPNAYGLTTNGVGAFTGTSYIVANRGAATGVLTGSTTSDFLGRLAAAPTPSIGGLALASADATANIDFTGTVGGAVNLSGANTVGMSIGAVLPGVTYTGTITPAAGGYRLGGGGGTLTLSNTNALTGANNVSIVNGGTVALTGSNNYSGVTSIKGDYVVSFAQRAAVDANNAIMLGDRVSPTLSVNQFAALGSSGTAASNLVINGGMLKYTGAGGAGGTTSRLFTIGSTGATLDASGTGALNFSNSGAIANGEAVSVTGNTTATGTVINNVTDISELSIGMTVSGGTLPEGTTITGFQPAINTTSGVITYAVRTSANATTATTGAALTFGAQNRALNLTGSNTANNTVAGSLGNSATGTLAVNKTGAGRWVLSNLSNSYTGGTNVSAGTLAVGRMHANNAVNITGGKLEVLESTPGLGSGHPAGNDASVSQPSSLTIAAGATLDVTNNDVILDYTGASPVATYEALVASAYNVGVGDWSGTGITSSVAQADGNYVVAIADNAALAAPFGTANGGPLFAGVDVDIDTILIKFTHRADVDLDGVITPNDAAIFGGNYSENDPAVWSTGDMDYDGIYTPNDAAIFGGFYDESLASLPEPGSLALLGLGGLALGARRRRVTVA